MMRRKYISLLLALALVLGLAACGTAEPNTTPEPTPEPEPTLPAGSYSFSESAMGGAFTVEWELELREDGTYTIVEHNPFMGDLTYEGEYEWDGETVTTLPFEGEPPLAEFFEADKSCLWTLDGESCKPVKYTESGADDTVESGGLTDIKYASNSDAQVLDLHQPEGDGPNPVIVLVHGGGFAFGDQAMPIIQPVIDAAVNAGYAVVSVDYRKSGEAAFPAALADVKAAVRFVRANAAEYGFDEDNIAIWGESAGAYLALMTALTPEVAELNGDVADNLEYSSTVKALVSFYAPVEFCTMDAEYAALGRTDTNFATADSFESKFLGFPIGEDEAAAYASYWGTYVDQLPADFELKAWIQVGDADQNVPYTQSVNFAERLAEITGDVNVSFSIIEGAGHEDSAFYTAENLADVLAFLDGVMK